MPTLFKKSLSQFIINIRKTGTADIKDEEQLKKVRLVNTLSLALVNLIWIIGIIFYILTWKLSILIPAMIECILALFPIILNYHKKFTSAALTIFLTQCAASLYFGVLLGNVIELQSVVFFLLLITFLLFNDSILRKLCFTIALIVLILLETNHYIGFIEQLPLSQSYSIIFKSLCFVGLFCLIMIVGAPYVKSYDASYELKRSLKMEENQNNAKSIFIRNASHEIQGTFVGIIKMVQSLKIGIEKKQDTKTLADEAIEACHTYKNMLTNLLEYTKIDAGVSDDAYNNQINIRSLLTKIINLNNYAALEKGVKINLSISNEIPEVLVSDELRLTQVCINLLTNAIKFTQPNSSIYITIDKFEANWQLSIKDEGEGISIEKQKEIFDLFVTNRNSDNNPEGVGLGLFITKRLVEDLLKGNIKVKSEPPSGACFEILLPFQ